MNRITHPIISSQLKDIGEGEAPQLLPRFGRPNCIARNLMGEAKGKIHALNIPLFC